MILVVNPGSSSIKYKLFEAKSFSEVGSGDYDCNKKNVKAAVLQVIKKIKDLKNIKKIGIRIVHGGDKYNKPVEISNQILSDIKKFSHLAPLHNPIAYKTIKLIKKYIPQTPIFAVFDTAFFSALPVESYTYPIPKKIAQKNAIRRYGFHGISHQYAYELVDPKKKYKVIIIHLGSGCSVSAVNKGKVVQTSMGFTPDAGLIMQTRSGDLDPGLVLYLTKVFGYKKTKEIIESGSGLYGLYEKTGSIKQILIDAGIRVSPEVEPLKTRNRNAVLSLKIFTNRIKEFIGSYSALMSGVDLIVFTGKVGFLSEPIRTMSIKGLKYLGYKKIVKIEPNEELAIAKEIA